MGKNKPYYIAVDSDVLRALAFADILLKNKTDFRTVKNSAIRNYGGYLRKLLGYMHEDKLRIIILNNVYQENKHSQSLVYFIVENCHVANITFDNYEKISDEVKRMAKRYCSPYTDLKTGRVVEAPMQMVYDAYLRANKPTNDAMNMAEASVIGVPFVTLNAKDYVFNPHSNKEVNERAIGILQINIQEGYYFEDDYGRYVAPKPFSLATFGALLQNIDNKTLSISEVPAEDVIRAKHIKEEIDKGVYDVKRTLR